MKVFKAFINSFEAPQRSVKVKISLNFFSLSGTGMGMFKRELHKMVKTHVNNSSAVAVCYV